MNGNAKSMVRTPTRCVLGALPGKRPRRPATTESTLCDRRCNGEDGTGRSSREPTKTWTGVSERTVRAEARLRPPRLHAGLRELPLQPPMAAMHTHQFGVGRITSW